MLKILNRFVIILAVLLTISCKTSFVKRSTDTENIATYSDAAPLDSGIVNMYLPYKNKLDEEMNEVISISDAYMQKARPESGLTNLLADLLLQEANLQAKDLGLNIKSDVSFFNYGGIRSSLPKGEIKRKNIFELMPFENKLVMIELDAKSLSRFLDKIAAKGGGSIGGATFTIDKDKKANHIKIKGQPLNSTQKYWLITNDYVANGGDSYAMFKNARKVNLKKKLRNTIIEFFIHKQHKGEIIQSKLDGRISYE